MLLPFLDPFSRMDIDADAPEHTAANQHGKQLDQRAQGRGLSQAQGNQKADGKQNGCTQQPQKEPVLPRASGTEKSCPMFYRNEIWIRIWMLIVKRNKNKVGKEISL